MLAHSNTGDWLASATATSWPQRLAARTSATTAVFYSKAAALLQSLATNHGFVDGNKRTTFLTIDLFLDRSGYVLRGVKKTGLRELEDLILAVVERHLTVNDIEAWFRKRVRR